MDKHEIKDRIDYIVMCVSEFAKRFNLTNQQAYAYLRRFSGIELELIESDEIVAKSEKLKSDITAVISISN